MNHTIRMLASYPPSGKEKGYEAPPGGVSAHYLFHPDKRSMNCGSGTVKRRWQPSWPARPGKGSAGSFPRVSGWQVHFLMAPLFTFQLVHVFFDALIEPSLQTNLPPAVQ